MPISRNIDPIPSSGAIIIPVYRGLSFAGNVLEKDRYGDMIHITVSDTSLLMHEGNPEVVFEVK